jgi:hypothetical protein
MASPVPPRAALALTAVAFAVGAGACIISFSGYELAPGDGGLGGAAGSLHGASNATGSGGAMSASSSTASTGSNAGQATTSTTSTAASSGTGGQCSGPIDPKLVLPAPDAGPPCYPPNDLCQSPALCVVDGPCSFVCVSCVACKPKGSACSLATDCDPGFYCYAGMCVQSCALSNPNACLTGQCKSVGNSQAGVCL